MHAIGLLATTLSVVFVSGLAVPQAVVAGAHATQSAAPVTEGESGPGTQAVTVETVGEGGWAAKSAQVLETQMAGMPDKRIPAALLKRAKCVAVFPSVIKAGIIVAAKRGDGLVSCRGVESGTWGAPAFFTVTGLSAGLQAGAEAADLILLVMNQKGIDGLLRSKVTLGADLGVTAGPVGRGTSVGTDVLLRSAIVSYARSRGLFAGVSLDGTTIRYNKKTNVKVYGRAIEAREILFDTPDVPSDLQVFHQALVKYAPKPEGQADSGAERERTASRIQ